MRFVKLTLSMLVLLSGLIVAPTTAGAAVALPEAPKTVHSYGFEVPNVPVISELWKSFVPNYTATNGVWTVGKDPLPYFGTSATYIWGPEPYSKRTGSYGLWCSSYDTVNKAYSYNWKTYQRNTAGLAKLQIADLSNYYSSTLEFWWKQPTRGAADSGSFGVLWGPLGTDRNNIATWDSFNSFPLSTSWQKKTIDLSTESLSRQQGEIQFRFANAVEGGSQAPTEAEGPTIDDVKVTGYWHGPVRDLAATSTNGSGVELSWGRPYRTVFTTDTEDRSIEYRVWRALQSNPTVRTELTDAPTGPISDAGDAVTWTDTSAVQGVSYVYSVVAFSTGTTDRYGQYEQVVGRDLAAGVDIQIEADPATVRSGDNVTFTYTVTNTGASALSDVTVTDDWGQPNDSPLASLAAGATHQFTRTRAISATDVYGVSVQANGGTPNSTASVPVTVIDPSFTVTAEPSQRWANAGKKAYFDVTLTNTGDTEITGITVNLGGVLAANVVESLPPSEQRTVTLTKAVSTDADVTLSASGSAAGLSVQADPASGVHIDVTPDRTFGVDRIRTSIEASKRLYPGTSSALSANAAGDKAVIIATGFDFPDALSASALAGAAEGPVLLVKKTTAHSAIQTELQRLGATKVYIVGGEAVVSPAVETQLRSWIPGSAADEVVRLAGNNRYHTAELVADEVKRLVELGGGTVDTVFLATGGDFPDALAASSLAAAMPAPVLLTKTSSLPSQTDNALKKLQPSTVVICGGEAAVAFPVESAIDGAVAYGSPVADRQAGSNRYGTAQKLIEWGMSPTGGDLDQPHGVDGVFLATGEDYPDALAGGALAGGADGMWRPLMLTKPTYLRSEAQSVISGMPSTSFVTLIGGTAAVSDVVKYTALQMLQ